MEGGFSYQDIHGLNKLLNPTSEKNTENEYYTKTGSVLKPSDLGNKQKENKELAKPYAKIEQKFNNRILTKPENQIWKEEELAEENFIEDERPKPEFDVLYRQKVGTEDVYFGMNGVDNSSNCCYELLVKVKLPNTNLKEIALEVKSQSIHLNVTLLIY